jgi:addiction module RelE/StbE family toxin
VFEAKFTADAKQDVRALPKNIRNSLREKLETVVCVNPETCAEELSGPLAGFRSYHCKDYRIIYKVFPETEQIAIVGIGKKDADHHAEIYKQLENLAAAGKLATEVLSNIRMIQSN